MDQTTVTAVARVPDPTGSHRYFAVSSVLPTMTRDFNCVSQELVQKLNQHGVYPQITPDPVAFLAPDGNPIPSGGTIALDISLAGVVATLSFDIYPGPHPNAMIIGMPGLRAFNANFDAASKLLTVGIAPAGLTQVPRYIVKRDLVEHPSGLVELEDEDGLDQYTQMGETPEQRNLRITRATLAELLG